MYRGILASVCILMLSSCSVKEFRGDCPCFLNLNVDDIVSAGEFRESLVSVASGSMVQHENIQLARYEGVGYELKVPRRMVHASLAAGIQKAARRNDTLIYSKNVEMDVLFAWNADLVCDDDMKYARPVLHKQYCNLILDILGSDEDYDLALRAGCNAVALLGLKPLAGEYSVPLRKKGLKRYEVRVPRQRDSWVLLDFICAGDVSVFDVGAGLAACGYDWSKADLDDAVVTVDMVQAKMSVSIKDWESEKLEINI